MEHTQFYSSLSTPIKVQKLHETENLDCTAKLTPTVKKAVVEWGKTQEKRPSRLVMTPDIMYQLKEQMMKARMPLVKKRLLWCVATTLFVG